MSDIFSSDQLNKTVTTLLNDGAIVVPNGHRVAVITHADLNGNIIGVVAAKINGDWSVQGLVDWSHHDGFNAGFNLVWSH